MSGSIPNNNDNAAADTDIPKESMISGNDYLKVLICSANGKRYMTQLYIYL